MVHLQAKREEANMKRRSMLPLSSLILVAAMVMLSTAATLRAQRVTNGGFESSGIGNISATGTKGWFIGDWGSITPPPVFEIVSDTVEEGGRALKVTLHGLGTNQWDIQIVADSILVTPGVAYTYAVWAKSTRPGATVNFTIGNYSYSEYGAIRPATLGTHWQRYTMQFTVSDGKTVIRAPIHFYGAIDTANSIYIDNLQIVDPNASKRPVTVEAESGTLGSKFPILHDSSVTFVDVTTDAANVGHPGDSSRVTTYQVQFPDSGSYNLFARVRVGSNGSTGSFFYGNGFGLKNDTSGSDWIAVDGLATIAGFSDPATFVDGPGTLGTGVWKWVNLTRNAYQGTKGNPFIVAVDNLSVSFQIGGGHPGLDIDKFAFGKSSLHFTVGNLDKSGVGVTDTAIVYKGPPLAEGQQKFLGCAYDLPDNGFATYWTQLTVGNAGKFGSVAVSTDTTEWNWSGLDTAYNYAINHHLVFKDHTLIWGQQQPSWISSLDSATQVYYIAAWIRKVGQRYPHIDMIDVVNEPLTGHNPPDGVGGNANYEKALGGKGSTGWDWVIKAFTLARNYLPGVKLLLNDFGIINDIAATTTYLQIIALLKQQGLIDGIGVQCHRFEIESADTTLMKNNLDRLAATGLPIYISEMDLGNLNNYGTPDDNQQLQFYQKIFPLLWRHHAIQGITLWGYLDGQMWQSSCYLLRADYTSRPAFVWLAQYVKNNPMSVEVAAADVPSRIELDQNYPNPFNPTTTIRYRIPVTAKVTLQVFDVLGREVQTLVNSMQFPGTYTVTLNAQNLATGVYLYRLKAGNVSETKKLLLMN
jgi:endo-1,4-beta-xylanase